MVAALPARMLLLSLEPAGRIFQKFFCWPCVGCSQRSQERFGGRGADHSWQNWSCIRTPTSRGFTADCGLAPGKPWISRNPAAGPPAERLAAPLPAVDDPAPPGGAHRGAPVRIGEYFACGVGDFVDYKPSTTRPVSPSCTVSGARPSDRRPPAHRSLTPPGTRCRAPRRPGRRPGCGTAWRTRRPSRGGRAIRRRHPAGEDDVVGDPDVPREPVQCLEDRGRSRR